MFKKKMTSIVVGTFAVMLLGGCGGASASPEADLVVSSVISQEKPTQDVRITLDPFADFEVVYYYDHFWVIWQNAGQRQTIILWFIHRLIYVTDPCQTATRS